MLQISSSLECDVSVVEESLRDCHDHPVFVDALGQTQALGDGDEVDTASHVVNALHVKQDPDDTVGTVLGQSVGQVVGVVLHLCRATSFRVGDVRTVTVVEVSGGACFGRSVALTLTLTPALPARVYDMVTNTLDPETELGDAADGGELLCQLFQHLQIFLKDKGFSGCVKVKVNV